MATKNNLDAGGEAPHHTELASRYRIEGNVYDLSQIVSAAMDDQANDEWNARTMGDRLDTVKAYLKSVDAEKVDETENTAGDGETVRDGNGNILEHPAQIAGSDGNDAGGSGKATAVQGDTMSDEDKQAIDLVRAGRAAVGPVDTLRALNQNDEADEVEELQQQNKRLVDQIDAIRDRLNAGDGLITDALDALFEKASEAEQRAVAAEQDASQLRDKVRRLEERSTRDKPLHGAVEDLKPPY